MAMSKNAENMLKSLARRGDSFARVILNQGQAVDTKLVSSLSKRGDVVAQYQTLGPAAISVRAKAIVGNLSRMGDMVAAGIAQGTLDVALACNETNPFAWCSGNLVFTATAVAPEGKTLSYRFLVDGVVKQTWGAGNTFTVTAASGQADFAFGSHNVVVEISSDASPLTPEGRAFVTVVSIPDAADQVVLSDDPASPSAAGSAVTFTAEATYTKGAGRESFTETVGWYQFSVEGVVVQPWSRSNTFVLPASTAAGEYDVKVDVSTAAVPTTAEATDTITYTLS